jgi:lipopolysaccharide/colanic/teichoic acid biosynthesis glycosyltransferase
MYAYIKRCADFIGALVLLVLLSPLFAVTALAIRVLHGKPVFFRQMRPGYKERLFTCLKFRTMSYACDANGTLLSDEERTSALGRFLRRTSLDELPQLWNILRGDLGFIGPRPLLVRYLPYYTQEERRRHSVRPGLTGWAQVQGRNKVPFEKRLELDVWYVDHMSLALDLNIALRTVAIVLTGRGVATDNIALDELRTTEAKRLAQTSARI